MQSRIFSIGGLKDFSFLLKVQVSDWLLEQLVTLRPESSSPKHTKMQAT